jgi:hypothetical protein
MVPVRPSAAGWCQRWKPQRAQRAQSSIEQRRLDQVGYLTPNWLKPPKLDRANQTSESKCHVPCEPISNRRVFCERQLSFLHLGIYGCEASRVHAVLQRGCIGANKMTDDDAVWIPKRGETGRRS